jgi:hypothetical protein
MGTKKRLVSGRLPRLPSLCSGKLAMTGCVTWERGKCNYEIEFD